MVPLGPERDAPTPVYTSGFIAPTTRQSIWLDPLQLNWFPISNGQSVRELMVLESEPIVASFENCGYLDQALTV